MVLAQYVPGSEAWECIFSSFALGDFILIASHGGGIYMTNAAVFFFPESWPLNITHSTALKEWEVLKEWSFCLTHNFLLGSAAKCSVLPLRSGHFLPRQGICILSKASRFSDYQWSRDYWLTFLIGGEISLPPCLFPFPVSSIP